MMNVPTIHCICYIVKALSDGEKKYGLMLSGTQIPGPMPESHILSPSCFLVNSYFFLSLSLLNKISSFVNLIIDIGNSAIKLALFEDAALLETFTEQGHTLDILPQLLQKYPIHNAILATVVDLCPELVKTLAALPLDLLWLNEKTRLPITNLYETPETLGYDRVAAVVGAVEQCPNRNLLVIDAGTAITFEFVDAAGRYHGGNISPGVYMRLKALHHFTSRLPLVNVEGRMCHPGKNTETAIRAGVLKGVQYEIEGYINFMRTKHPDLLVFLTGGDLFSFDATLKKIIFADKFLVLKGLNRILMFNRTPESKGT